MKNKLPEIFKSQVENVKTNIQKSFYYHHDNKMVENLEKQDEESLLKKINNILNSENHIYNTDIIILCKNGETINKKIIGYKDGYLLFLDESKMPLSDVYDIK